MFIDYVSSAMDENDFYELFSKSQKLPGQQAQKFNRLLIYGLAENGIMVNAISGRPITPSNYSGKYLPTLIHKHGNIKWHYLSVHNTSILKRIWQMCAAFHAVWIESKSGENVIILDVLNASIAYGASIAAKLRKRPCIGIVTDLPQLMVTGSGKIQTKIVNKVISNCTGYVFLTEAMNSVINPRHKPYIIVEGVCDTKMSGVGTPYKSEVRKCVYAGFLDAKYGVKILVDGFIKADLQQAELHLFGYGPYTSELQEIIREHKNIIFHGNVPNDNVVKAELEASLLINPRPSHEEFTKYSFPSKNLEYMVSGTPVLTTPLPGMPKEYYDYVFLLDDETVDGVADSIKRLFSLNEIELKNKGAQAKSFVIKEKNNIKQAKRIIRLIEMI